MKAKELWDCRQIVTLSKLKKICFANLLIKGGATNGSKRGLNPFKGNPPVLGWATRPLYTTIIIAFSLLLFHPPVEAINRVKITGEYQYTYGDNESLITAKNLCYAMAVRNALESYKTFITTTSKIQDYQLLSDLLQSISSGYIEDVQTVEETIKGRTIYTKVEGYLIPTVADKILETELERAQDTRVNGYTKNNYVKILTVRETSRYIYFTFKTLDPNYPPYNFDFVINYYDRNGNPITGRNVGADSFMRGKKGGELGRFALYKPDGAKFYRYWLTDIDEIYRQNAWLNIIK